MHLKFGNFVLYITVYRLTESTTNSVYKTVHVER